MASTEDYFERQDSKNEIISLAEKGEWRKIIKFYDENSDYREPLLVWIRPSLGCLAFLADNCGGSVLSVGCGCAFLEFLLRNSHPEIKVAGLEVNSGWWESKHSTPHFIDLNYTEPSDIPFQLLNQYPTLLFCYFNGIKYFTEYLNAFTGSSIILIGPMDGKRHCDPEPDYLGQGENYREWKLTATHDIRGEGQDSIYVYTRKY